jgi:hypothetical protein
MAAVLLIGMQAAFASHPEVSLAGSNFEIDTDANLKVDDPAPSIDWASVTETRKADSPSGATDESFGNGTKEDTAVPSIVTGGIPPNKSDLKFFGVYQEGTTSNGFLNLYWSRVQEPTGTTNMDFEFNQSSVKSANGQTPVRTAGDLLIIYDLSQGGTRPSLSLRIWTGSAWGPATDLTASNKATGSINTSPIPAGEADGLGAHSARTFGEAQIALSAIFDPTKCTSFGSAYLKSRSSDSFTAALKDFVPPQSINISNCGKILVDKVTQPSGDPQSFNFTLKGGPSNLNQSFSLTDAATPHDSGGLLAGSGYNVAETVPDGWDLTSATCDDNSPITNIDVSVGETVKCTFTNTKQGKIRIDKVTDPPGDETSFPFTLKGGPSALDKSFSLKDADDPNETAVKPGSNYVAAENTPSGWDLTNTTCNDSNSTVGNIDVAPGETVTCTFTNTQQRGKILVDKVTKPGNDPQKFSFNLSGGPSNLDQSFQLADQDPKHDSGAVLSGSGYNVAETVPDGWDLTSATCDDGSPITNINVGVSETVTCTFENTKRGHILIDKVTDPPGDETSFPFTLKGGPSALDQSFQLADQTAKHDSGAIKPGNGYSAAETTQPGWDLTSATCSNDSPVDNIDVAPGETVTCTFTNTKKTTTITTSQRFFPNDTATISGTGTGTPNGKVDFELYEGTGCTGEPVFFEKNVPLEGPDSDTAKTTNGDGGAIDDNHSAEYTISGDGTHKYSWKVSYHGDTTGHTADPSCVEESTVTIDNDNTP